MDDRQAVAVTGASGFIGTGVVPALSKAGIPVHAISRQAAPQSLPDSVTWYRVPSYDDMDALTEALQGASLVVHLADNPERAKGRGTADGVQIVNALTGAMASTGTNRLVLMSSVYARIAPQPGSYGHAKAAIETALSGVFGPLRVVLRLPPVYGPGGRGGFAMLAKLAAKGLPLPFGLARAPRDYLARANLADLTVALAQADMDAWTAADGQVFEPSDGHVISTADLVRALATVQGKAGRLLPVPLGLLRLAGNLTGKTDMVAGAINPLEAKGNADLTRIFGWVPHARIPESLGFLAHQERNAVMHS